MLDNTVARWAFTDYGATLYTELLKKVQILEDANKLLIEAAIKHEDQLNVLARPTVKFPPRLN